MALCTSPRCRSFHFELDHEIAVIDESDSESDSESDDESADKSAEVSAQPSDDVQPTAKQLPIVATPTSAQLSDDAPPALRSPTRARRWRIWRAPIPR